MYYHFIYISTTRRKLVKIEDDITTLYNYTETISDFIVGDYILPEVQLNLILKEENKYLRNSFDEFKNETFRIIENNKK